MEAAARDAMSNDLAALEADLRDDAALPVMHDPRLNSSAACVGAAAARIERGGRGAGGSRRLFARR
jgi:hypothetical protein